MEVVRAGATWARFLRLVLLNENSSELYLLYLLERPSVAELK